MKFLFRVILLFLIVFIFPVPVFVNSAFVSIFLATVYYIIIKRKISFTYFFQRYNVVILIGTIALAIILILIAYFHGTEIMSTKERRAWVEFMMLFAGIYILPILIEDNKSTAWEEVALIICCAYALQGIISLTAYLYQPLGDYLFSMKPNLQYEGADMDIDNKFRYYNLSGVLLVELTACFGVALIVFFWLQVKSNHLNMSGWKKYLIFFFIFLGTVFSGRTGFIGLLMGLCGWLFFSFDRVFLFIKRNTKYIIGFTLVLFIFYNSILTERQRQSFNDEIFPFAFEWYYNYRDYGKFEVGSAEATSEHFYPLYDETLLTGHGVMAYGGLFYLYRHSDAGYINTLVFGGIPLLIFLIIYQCLYFALPLAVAFKNKSHKSQTDCGFFLLLFIYIFIVEIKAPVVGFLHAIEVMYLILGSSYIIQYHARKEQEELTG